MKRSTLSIRRATPRDATLVLKMIRGLAEYERLAHQMEATVGQIRRHGFGRRRYFEALICRRGRTAIGFALYFFTFSTFVGRPTLYLEDLFVLPEERGRGAGKALLSALARIAVRRGCGRGCHRHSHRRIARPAGRADPGLRPLAQSGGRSRPD